ncbi:uncharacterized protein NMK_0857 [Novimethylophilus kurashikiensis]|jgi:hypothetical protein|uniref:DUF1656 domain-containing protein n=1 Tax=Novimethylophilus kurashikiensis TaxID=1825523 RepID=A0A2R5F9E9_9PROT|nr:DUF1656 domain-containing protein [Novimethylophilus kurashikiensis]GBG13311.1 uncharacterized protein NMK_0857 [Novimethylophilus kurashikiensis]
MPREIAFFDALIPTILLALIGAAVVSWTLDWVFARYRLYRLIWYPALFRLSLFACLFAALGLAIY